MTETARPTPPVTTLANALPFWMSLVFVPMVIAAAAWGGWMLLLIPIYGWIVMSVLDQISGLNLENLDPQTEDSQLFWHKLITLIWPPIQLSLIFGCLMVVSWTSHLSTAEEVLLMVVLGFVTGTVGINYAHELIHQKNRLEQRLGEILLISVLYGHFKSEHVLVHHRYVGTPRDPVTARYKEGFFRFFPRVLVGQIVSAWEVEVERLERKGKGAFDLANPFWRYFGGALLFIALAWTIGGWFAVALYVVQSFFAILQLELVNYVEHYGLTRKHLGDGKYEHVKPRHSWNAAHRMTNYLLINLQRHSDHHYKPDRRFPLLQNYEDTEAPQLPFGYPLMVAMALMPPLWMRVMDPRVREWRERHYPEIKRWGPYRYGTNPMPR